MMEILKEEHKGRIVLCNNGSFYIAIGNDAVLLNKVLGLKLSCMGIGICKVGFPIESLEKYTELLIKTGYSFVIYEKEDLAIIISYAGKRLNEEIEKNKCYCCNRNKRKNKKLDKYTRALVKMYEQEEKEIREERKRKREEKEKKELENEEEELKNKILKLKNGE